VLGALADSVQEVIELDPASIAPPPRMGTRVDTRFIRGMGKRDDQFFIVLDIELVLSEDELRTVASTQPPVAGTPAP
jgi:purine-binding chemotaxis protein CheW